MTLSNDGEFVEMGSIHGMRVYVSDYPSNGFRVPREISANSIIYSMGISRERLLETRQSLLDRDVQPEDYHFVLTPDQAEQLRPKLGVA